MVLSGWLPLCCLLVWPGSHLPTLSCWGSHSRPLSDQLCEEILHPHYFCPKRLQSYLQVQTLDTTCTRLDPFCLRISSRPRQCPILMATTLHSLKHVHLDLFLHFCTYGNSTYHMHPPIPKNVTPIPAPTILKATRLHMLPLNYTAT